MSHGEAPLTLHEAARLFASTQVALHDAEAAIVEAIEHGRLRADVKRWATEQWEGRRLPGNINGSETRIERSDFDAWLQAMR